MPVKVRELKARLRRAGFTMKSGKGSHTNWFHPRYPGRVTLSGSDGADAKDYQVAKVGRAVQTVQEGE